MPSSAGSANSVTGYRQLDETQIVATITRLRARIEERFPGSGLGRVGGELLALAGEATDCVSSLRRPLWWLRAGVALVIAGMLAVVLMVAASVRMPAGVNGLGDFIQTVEAAINEVVLLGIAVFFLVRIEGRLKRRRALAALHQLRSVVHIVDMHQLTKDPERLLFGHADTASSPARTMTALEIGRYLDYCSELFSLTSKVAALFVQHFDDPVVLAAVNEIQTLAAGFSNKVWQKITLLERLPVSPVIASDPAAGTARATLPPSACAS